VVGAPVNDRARLGHFLRAAGHANIGVADDELYFANATGPFRCL